MSLEGEDDLPPVTGVEDAPAPKTDDVEAIARELGWKPESEWKGKPPEKGFASAADYIRSQRDHAKNVEKEMKKLRSETDKRIKRMEDQTAKQREREIAEIHEEYDWWIRDAIKKGDDGREKALIKERDGKVKQAEAVEEKEEAADEPATEEEWVEAFQPAYPELQKRFYGEGHAWVLDEDADPDAMRIVLDFVDSGVPFAEALEKSARALKKAYPDRYEEDEDMDEEPEEKPAKKRVPVLASGAKAGGSGVSAASRLSPAQRTIGAKFVKDGLFGSLEEYAEERLKLG